MHWMLKSFLAGFVSTLAFHQGVLGLLYLLGVFPRAPFNLTPVPPLGVPAVVSLAFWGGIWGIALWWMIRNATGAKHWLLALAIGAIGPTAVALLVVFPLKGMPVAGGGDLKLVAGALILNGAWGLGVALLMRWTRRL